MVALEKNTSKSRTIFLCSRTDRFVLVFVLAVFRLCSFIVLLLVFSVVVACELLFFAVLLLVLMCVLMLCRSCSFFMLCLVLWSRFV